VSDEREPPPPTIVEWSGHLLSILLLLTLVGYVGWMAFQPSTPIAFDYRVLKEEISERGGSWVLPVEVHNQGSSGILDILITAELKDGEEVVDQADISLPLLGPDESVRVELWFDEDPRRYTLSFNVGSYALP
jgi:uncharacterized protein (TIGR02588 family)